MYKKLCQVCYIEQSALKEISIAKRECVNSPARNGQTQKVYHNCKTKGGKEKGLKEKACQCWQQRMGMLEDKQTKAIVGNKNQVTGDLLSITEVTTYAFFNQKAKYMMTVNWI